MSNDSSKGSQDIVVGTELGTEPEHQLPWGALGSVLVAIGSFFMSQVLAVFTYTLLVPDVSFEQLSFDTNQQIFSIVALVAMFEFILVYAYVLAKKGTFRDLKIVRPELTNLLRVLPAYVMYVISLLVVTQVAQYFLSADVINQEQDIGFQVSESILELGFIFIALVVIAPVLEEIVFRGFMFQGLTKNFGHIGAALISSGLFALAHMQINVGIDTFILGLASCWLMVKSKSIWPSVALHAFKNGIAFVLLFIVDMSF